MLLKSLILSLIVIWNVNREYLTALVFFLFLQQKNLKINFHISRQIEIGTFRNIHLTNGYYFFKFMIRDPLFFSSSRKNISLRVLKDIFWLII